MSETLSHSSSQNPVIVEGYTYIYNRILSALQDDNVNDETTRISFAKQITDAIWALHLSINKTWPTEKYNNFSNTKSMVNSIINTINNPL